VNFTQVDNSIVTAMFAQTGDAMIQDMSHLEKIVSNDIDVALVYGDRDYECNCTTLLFYLVPVFHEMLTITRDRHREYHLINELPIGLLVPLIRIYTYQNKRQLQRWTRPTAWSILVLASFRGWTCRDGLSA
jgi:hypothetical protein